MHNVVKYLIENWGLSELVPEIQNDESDIKLYFSDNDGKVVEQFRVYGVYDTFRNINCIFVTTLIIQKMLFIYPDDNINEKIDEFLLKFPIFVSVNRENKINEILNTHS